MARRRAEVEVARRQAAAAAHRELLQGKEAGTQEEGPCLQAVPSPPEAPPPQGRCLRPNFLLGAGNPLMK